MLHTAGGACSKKSSASLTVALLFSTDLHSSEMVPFISLPNIESVPLATDTVPVLLDGGPAPLSGQFNPSYAHRSSVQWNMLLSKWLKEWLDHTKYCSHELLVPPPPTHINTTLNLLTWRCLLSRYPDQQMAKFFLDGIQAGF